MAPAKEFDDSQPDWETRSTARRLLVNDVKAIHLNLDLYLLSEQTLSVTRHDHISALMEGLKTATETSIMNQVSSVQVVGKNGQKLLNENFAMHEALDA